MTDFSIPLTPFTGKNIYRQWRDFGKMMGVIHDISLYIHYYAHYFARESGKYSVNPFPQGGMLVPHRATLRSLSLVPCTWVTRDNWNAVKVLFEENSAVKGPDLELATPWDIARHPPHHTYYACAMYESSEKYIFRNQSGNRILLCNVWIFHTLHKGYIKTRKVMF